MDELRKIVIDYLLQRDGDICRTCGKKLKPPMALDYGTTLECTHLAHRYCLTGNAYHRKLRAVAMDQEGKSRPEIATLLGVSVRTVFNYLRGE